MPYPPAISPYDPPPSSSSPRRPSSSSFSASRPQESFFTRLDQGLAATSHLAEEAEYVAQEVGKAAGVARRVVGDVEEAYGQAGGAGGGRGGRGRGGGESESEREEQTAPLVQQQQQPKVVPYSRPPSSQSHTASIKQRKKTVPAQEDELARFEEDLDTTQATVDDLSDLVERIAVDRHRLTGGPYPRIAKLLKLNRPASLPQRSQQVDEQEAQELVERVKEAKRGVLEQYEAVCSLQPRFSSLSSSLHSSGALSKTQKHLLALNASFASLLDFIEARAEDEKKDQEGGESEARVEARMREERPEWRKGRRAEEGKKARMAVREKGVAAVGSKNAPYAIWWLVDNPFTELDGALQTIDLKENKMASKKDEKEGTWAKFESAVSTVLAGTTFSSSPSRKPSTSSKSSSSTAAPAYHELSHSHPHSRSHSNSRSRSSSSRSHRYHSESKPALSDSEGSDGEGDDEKKLLGLDPDNLPERVPTDDTSGYQESKEELLEDARDQSRTEHFYTPLLVAWWVSIACLYLYYLIARLMGYANPLGNVDLGSHLGNSAWNDTSDGLVRTTASATPTPTPTPTETSLYEEPTMSEVPLTQVEASASVARAVMSSIRVSATSAAVGTASSIVGDGAAEVASATAGAAL
ncbi:hypothetical protein JCM8547_002493 [Rhodosporidiobolus lusitaniae]